VDGTLEEVFPVLCSCATIEELKNNKISESAKNFLIPFLLQVRVEIHGLYRLAASVVN
jgi:hypothetical protein